MKKITKPILIALSIMLWHFTNAQIHYSYDANGNRYQRNTVSLAPQAPDTVNQDAPVEIIEKLDYLKLESKYNEKLGLAK